MTFDHQEVSGRKRHITIAVVLLIIAISWLNVIDRKAEDYVNQSSVQALSIFGTLRLANAAISVVKSVEIDVFVASVQFGKLLDPVDDLIEDASSVLKMAIGSLLVQKILAEIVSTGFFKLLITASGLLLIASLYLQHGRFSGFLLKTFALVGVTRFLFVLVIFLNGLVDQAFVDDRTTAQHENLKGSSSSIASVGQQARELDEQDPDVVKTRDRMAELEGQQLDLRESAAEAEEQVSSAQAELESAEKELSAIKEKVGLTERYFSDNPEYEQQKELVELRESTLSESITLLDGYMDKLDKIDEEMEQLNDELLGDDKGFVESAKEMMDIGRINQQAENLVDSALNLMALLTLKAIIIPVIFLVLLLKGFRYIWGIDARDLGSEQWQNMKSELNRKPSSESQS